MTNDVVTFISAASNAHSDEANGTLMGYLGITLVALGAEIPDCVQSVQAARRG